jgi:hypothetical protein
LAKATSEIVFQLSDIFFLLLLSKIIMYSAIFIVYFSALFSQKSHKEGEEELNLNLLKYMDVKLTAFVHE